MLSDLPAPQRTLPGPTLAAWLDCSRVDSAVKMCRPELPAHEPALLAIL